VGYWGPGDVKLSAAVGLWVGFSLELLRFFLVMSLAGGVLVFIALAWQLVSGKPQLPPDDPHMQIPNPAGGDPAGGEPAGGVAKVHPLKGKVRYGIAIAIGALDYWFRHSQAACLISTC